MGNIFARLKREFLGLLPTVIFFFVVFQLLAFTQVLILKQYDIEVSTFMSATFGALVVGKVVLVADMLPFMNRFPDRPLIYNIAWKTIIYVIAALLVRYFEDLIPLLFEYRNPAVANRQLFNEMVWPHFWLVQLWLMVCFFMYCTGRELGRVLGYEQIRTMIFGPGRPGPA